MNEVSPFSIKNFLPQTRVRHCFVSKVELWCNILLKKFGNCTLNCKHSYRKRKYKLFRVFGCQSEERFIFVLIKPEDPDIMVFGVVTYSGDVISSFSTYMASFSIWRSTSSTRRRPLLTWFDPATGVCAMSHKQENSFGCNPQTVNIW